jgi:hypothetical protein
MEWVSQITAVALEIVGCIWLGRYLDAKLGTTFLALIGLFLGPAIGFYHLLTLTGVIGGGSGKKSNDDGHRDA